MNVYEHEGKTLDKPISAELIIELFNGKQNIKREIINDKVIQTHYERGGKPMEDQWSITNALDALKVLRFADNPKHGYWNISPVDQMIARLSIFT